MEEKTTLVAIRAEEVGLSAMPMADLARQVKQVGEIMQNIMKEGEHYGKIPGCGDKPTLLKAGAEKLCFAFRIAPKFEIEERQLPNNHREYKVISNLTHIGTGAYLGQGVGIASTMESKYRWRNASLKCPACGKETIIKGREEYGGGWLCFAKKGGCGAKFPDGDKAIEGQERGKVENQDIADVYNTVLKMAKKRSLVDGTLTATAASDILTQDIEDMAGVEAEFTPAKKGEAKFEEAVTEAKDATKEEMDKLHKKDAGEPPVEYGGVKRISEEQKARLLKAAATARFKDSASAIRDIVAHGQITEPKAAALLESLRKGVAPPWVKTEAEIALAATAEFEGGE